MTMNVYLLHKIIVSVLMLVMIAGCNNDESDTVTAYLKQMTEVAVIIENARGQEGATEAAAQILKKRSYINDLVIKSDQCLNLKSQNCWSSMATGSTPSISASVLP